MKCRLRFALTTLALLLLSGTAFGEGTIYRGALLDASFGAYAYLSPAQGNPPVFLHFDLLQVAMGFRFDRHFGAGLGTAVVGGDLMNTLYLFPATGYVFYDLNPDGRWSRGMLDASVSYVYFEQDGWSATKHNAHFDLRAGVSYTYYAVNPRFEVGYDTYSRVFKFAVGLGIPGGTFVVPKQGAGSGE